MSAAAAQLRLNQNTGAGAAILLHRDVQFVYRTENTVLGRARTTYEFRLTADNTHLHDGTVTNFVDWVRSAFAYARARSGGLGGGVLYKLTMVRPFVEFLDREGHSGIGTPFMLNPMADMIGKLYNVLGKYDDYEDDYNLSFTTILVEVTHTGNRVAGRAGERYVILYKDYILISPRSHTNCGFTSTVMSYAYKMPNNASLLTDVDKQNRAGSRIKAGAKCQKVQAVDEHVLQRLANYAHRNIELYDSQFRIEKLIEPSDAAMEAFGNPKWPDPARIYHHMGHFWALIKKDELLRISKPIHDELTAAWAQNVALTPEQVTDHQLKMFKANYAEFPLPDKQPDKLYDGKIAVIDSETYDDGEKFVPYAWGLSWLPPKVNTATMAPADWDMYFKMFKGDKDCSEQLLNYLYEQRQWFDGTTIYAHHGARFDFPILFQAALSKSSQWKMLGRRFVVQNGAIICMVMYCPRYDTKDAFDMDEMDYESGGESSSDYSSPEEAVQADILENDEEFTNETEDWAVFLKNNYVITFMDSLRILTGSLEQLCNDFKTKHRKLPDLVDHASITKDNWDSQQPQLYKYVEHDCKGLLEIMHVFSRQVWESSKINVTRMLTGASLAKRNFFQNFYKRYIYPIYHLKTTQDTYIRSGYVGGMVQAFQMGLIDAKKIKSLLEELERPPDPKGERIRKYDITSSYPRNGLKMLPYDKATIYLKKDADRIFPQPNVIAAGFHGYVRVKVRGPFKLKPWQLPGHACIQDQRLVFPIFQDPKELVLYSEEIKDMAGRGYEYEFMDALGFRPAKHMKEVFEAAFAEKAEADKKGQIGVTAAAKIKANSTYGMLGLNVDGRDCVTLLNKKNPELGRTLDHKLNAEKVKSWAEYGHYGIIRSEDSLEIKDFNVGIAAAITSYARGDIQRAIEAFRKLGYLVFYTDTDSLATNGSMLKHPELIQQFFWDGKGAALGTLKNECDKELMKHIKKHLKKVEHAQYSDDTTKEYSERVQKIYDDECAAENVPGDLSFDTMVVCGNKSYALRRHMLVHKQFPELVCMTLKGVRKSDPIDSFCLDYDRKRVLLDENGVKLKDNNRFVRYDPPQPVQFHHYEIMANGGAILQRQTQFRSGNDRLVDDRLQGGVKVVKLTKCISATYTKGIVNPMNGSVTPLVLRQADYDRQKTFTKERFRNLDNLIDPAHEPIKPVRGRKRKANEPTAKEKRTNAYWDQIDQRAAREEENPNTITEAELIQQLATERRRKRRKTGGGVQRFLDLEAEGSDMEDDEDSQNNAALAAEMEDFIDDSDAI